jgi:hypothetical protein
MDLTEDGPPGKSTSPKPPEAELTSGALSGCFRSLTDGRSPTCQAQEGVRRVLKLDRPISVSDSLGRTGDQPEGFELRRIGHLLAGL